MEILPKPIALFKIEADAKLENISGNNVRT
jgi:hypothetical protein